MSRVTILCSKCGQPVDTCRDNNLCEDVPEKNSPEDEFWYMLNHSVEEMLRWLRNSGIIK